MAWKQNRPSGYPEQIDPASGDYAAAFEAADYADVNAVALRGRAIWDTPVYNNFGGTGRGTLGPSDSGSFFAIPVVEMVATNAPAVDAIGTTENITRWNPWVPGANGYSQGGDVNHGSAQEIEPLPVSSHMGGLFGTANFFASDPSLWGANLSMQTSWEHMALGGSVMLGHQTFVRSPIQQQFSPEFYPSTVYEAAPSFGSVVPKVV